MIAGLIWIAASWLFLLAVVAPAALHRWRVRERHDAAETAAVMASLTAAPELDHRWDA